MKKTIIYVATHKPYENLADRRGYQLIHVGAKNSSCKIGDALKDDVGDNISHLNPIYCELTGQYWIWKNGQSCDYTGLVHYRRFLAKRKYSFSIKNNILNSDDINDILQTYDIILPNTKKKTVENGYYEDPNLQKQDRSYQLISEAISSICPEYLDDFHNVFASKYMSFGNIIITKKEIFDDYSEWLFSIESEILRIRKNDIRPRELGYLSEWLLNVYIFHHRDYKVCYKPVFYTEKSNSLRYFLILILERLGIVK